MSSDRCDVRDGIREARLELRETIGGGFRPQPRKSKQVLRQIRQALARGECTTEAAVVIVGPACRLERVLELDAERGERCSQLVSGVRDEAVLDRDEADEALDHDVEIVGELLQVDVQ